MAAGAAGVGQRWRGLSLAGAAESIDGSAVPRAACEVAPEIAGAETRAPEQASDVRSAALRWQRPQEIVDEVEAGGEMSDEKRRAVEEEAMKLSEVLNSSVVIFRTGEVAVTPPVDSVVAGHLGQLLLALYVGEWKLSYWELSKTWQVLKARELRLGL